jgi:hypothetical protein
MKGRQLTLLPYTDKCVNSLIVTHHPNVDNPLKTCCTLSTLHSLKTNTISFVVDFSCSFHYNINMNKKIQCKESMKENRKWTKMECFWYKLTSRQQKMLLLYGMVVMMLTIVGAAHH